MRSEGRWNGVEQVLEAILCVGDGLGDPRASLLPHALHGVELTECRECGHTGFLAHRFLSQRREEVALFLGGEGGLDDPLDVVLTRRGSHADAMGSCGGARRDGIEPLRYKLLAHRDYCVRATVHRYLDFGDRGVVALLL